jgi:hypothetical protein
MRNENGAGIAKTSTGNVRRSGIFQEKAVGGNMQNAGCVDLLEGVFGCLGTCKDDRAVQFRSNRVGFGERTG